jgi:7-cyano-7-deazaguanosine (preQ0) biosynthesis protein QueE
MIAAEGDAEPLAAGELTIAEVFGPTFQGEGPSIGRLCGFVRLGGCNLRCTWCDTPYTWDWTGVNGRAYDPRVELRQRSTGDILQELGAMGVSMVVLTGGEPLLHGEKLRPLLHGCRERNWRTEVETNGTIAPTGVADLVTQFNVSPKLSNSGNPLAERYRPDVLRAFEATGKAIFKFVVCGSGDLSEIDEIVGACGLSTVYVMPEGTDAERMQEHMRAVAEQVLARRWNLTTRLHVQIWGNRRGV